jgi:hypothetical protein
VLGHGPVESFGVGHGLDQVDAGGLRQEPRDSFADEVVVVGEDDAHRHGLTVGARDRVTVGFKAGRGTADESPVTSPAGIVPAYDDPPHEAPTGVLRDRAASAAVILMLAWWASYLLWGTGGREPHVLSVSCGLLLVSTLLVQPWRVLGPRTMLLGCSIGVAAFLVVLTAPTGWAGAHEAASYTHAGLLGVVVLAWARTAPRRLVLHVTVIAAAGLQFSQGWLAWWGNGDQTELFRGRSTGTTRQASSSRRGRCSPSVP